MPGTTSSASPLPPHVDLLVAFTNSVDHELGTDDLITPAELTRWLVDQCTCVLLAVVVSHQGDVQAVAQPAQDGVRGALAQVLVAVTDATADDTWPRLKICAADDCRWAYVDTTKNRSRAWCEWGCGNKAKTRSYRARKKAAAAR